MTQQRNRVVGFFAYRSPTEVLCTDVDACLIAGSEAAMRTYLRARDPTGVSRHTIRKTRFGEILGGLNLGAAYAFDEVAYSRFYPLALEAGLPVSAADFAQAASRGDQYFTVRLTSG
jgi:hypothetical protein